MLQLWDNSHGNWCTKVTEAEFKTAHTSSNDPQKVSYTINYQPAVKLTKYAFANKKQDYAAHSSLSSEPVGEVFETAFSRVT